MTILILINNIRYLVDNKLEKSELLNFFIYLMCFSDRGTDSKVPGQVFKFPPGENFRPIFLKSVVNIVRG